MSEDDDYEDVYVLTELSGMIDPEYFSKCDPSKCRLWGVDSAQPILQLDKYFFVGKFEDSVGTSVLFEEDNEDAEGSGKSSEGMDGFLTSLTGDSQLRPEQLFNLTSSYSGQSAADASRPKLRYFERSFKKLDMQRAFITKKDASAACSQDSDVEDAEAELSSKPSDVEVALDPP